ncbi:hypothetical protein CYMTET_42619 [Cymbomonas tetramitiformis]|uniref:Arrestin-like N-terminal domain-containing protein n=1 Tax=Cymbomonas tetramitiformis TaxID=36881 RepID=A0AAE0F1H5_9CHLO|nr:hypothetical protein CYMTET_42619 [Cymbomonas tetramitiformis]|eukprot:gene10541-12471_t
MGAAESRDNNLRSVPAPEFDPSKEKFYLGVTLEKEKYYAGEVVQGYVQFMGFAGVPLYMESLLLTFVGSAQSEVRWSTSSSRTGPGGRGGGRSVSRHSAKQSVNIVNLQKCLANYKKTNNMAKPFRGVHKYPFRFQIPEQVPSSFLVGPGEEERNPCTAAVVYTVGARIRSCTGGFFTNDYVCGTNIEVVGRSAPLPANWDAVVEDIQPVNTCYLWGRGNLELAARLDKGAVVLGRDEDLSLTYEVKNPSEQDVTSVEATIRRSVWFRAAENGDDKAHVDIAEETMVLAGPGPDPHRRGAVIPAVPAGTNTQKITVPIDLKKLTKLMEIPTFSSGTLNVSYKVILVAKTDSFSSWPEVAVNFTVGHPDPSPDQVGEAAVDPTFMEKHACEVGSMLTFSPPVTPEELSQMFGDEEPQIALYDSSGDNRPNCCACDTNRDEKYNLIGYDTTGDGVPDVFYSIPDEEAPDQGHTYKEFEVVKPEY